MKVYVKGIQEGSEGFPGEAGVIERPLRLFQVFIRGVSWRFRVSGDIRNEMPLKHHKNPRERP